MAGQTAGGKEVEGGGDRGAGGKGEEADYSVRMMQPETRYALVGRERVAYQVLGQGPSIWSSPLGHTPTSISSGTILQLPDSCIAWPPLLGWSDSIGGALREA